MKAGLLAGAPARESWDRWRETTGGFADDAARRLLPLVEWNLKRGCAGATEPGFLENEWIQSEERVAHAIAVLQDLTDRGLRPVALKGLALAHLVYPHQALRPMGDIDLLVAPAEFEPARAALEHGGWRPVVTEPSSRLRHLHGLAYQKPGWPEVDLHAHALLECCSPEADRGFFARVIELEISGRRIWTLSPADHLLCICVHGLRWSAVPAVYWAADALLLLRRHGAELNWDVLVQEARTRDLALPVASALRWLRENLDENVPDRVLADLARHSRGWLRRWELDARSRPPALGAGLFLHWRDLGRERGDSAALKRILIFPRYLRELWGLDRAWKLPLAAARKSMRRIARRRR
ncbi:MAG TPA: nucleotidyltransferase family protein [Thermoanaerobaculia bacterium]|nr:nucleotidyltransferase family protein [Thermoanaerobaculia bacterium]